MSLKDYFISQIQTGRIAEIGEAACRFYKVDSYNDLSASQKLNALCCAMSIDSDSLDSIINNHSEVKRTVKGHAFEIVFEKMMRHNQIPCTDIGGDGDVDLIVNGRNAQLKTPYIKGCSYGIVSYKTHKTHGAKSEQESFDYYHKVADFADFLIGLVSYDPFQVVIKEKHSLPRIPDHNEYIQSPMFLDISQEGINEFHLLGINKQLDFPQSLILLEEHELLPNSSKALEIKSDYILTAIFRPENFRIWDMNMRGFIREWALDLLFASHNITVFPPAITGLMRPEKSDCVLQKKSGEYVRFQIKGLTYSGCTFSGKNSRIDCETQLSRGRVNDHPTQSRLYKTSDFEYIIMAVDPPYSNRFSKEYFKKSDYNWSFYCVPVSALSTHTDFPSRISSHQYIPYGELQQYRIDTEWLSQWN